MTHVLPPLPPTLVALQETAGDSRCLQGRDGGLNVCISIPTSCSLLPTTSWDPFLPSSLGPLGGGLEPGLLADSVHKWFWSYELGRRTVLGSVPSQAELEEEG